LVKSLLERSVVSITQIASSSDPTHKVESKVILGGEVLKEVLVAEEKIDIFTEMTLKKRMAKKTEENLFSQVSHEGPAPPRLIASIDCENGTLHMATLQPKVDKLENDIKPHEYETTKVTSDLNHMPP
jgi:hypothetical protein